MASACCPYSTSWAKPNLPARELRATTGKTTLMAVADTPREDVLARSTGTGPAPGPAPAEPFGLPAPVALGGEALVGAEATHTEVPIRTAPTITTVRIWVPRGRRRKCPHDPATAAAGFHRDTRLTRLPRRSANRGGATRRRRCPPRCCPPPPPPPMGPRSD